MPKKIQTPGSILKTLLAEKNLPVSRLAEGIGTSDALMYLITQDKGRITIPVAFRLAKYLKTTPEYWLHAQLEYDIALARQDKNLQAAIAKIGKTPAAKPAKKGRAAKVKK